MKLASFKIGNRSTWGVIENEEAIDVGAPLRDRYPDLKSTIPADALPAARDDRSDDFRIPRQIEYCPSSTRLERSDVIATGTPGGVGSRRTPPLWLKPADIVGIEIDRLGVLRNGVGDETWRKRSGRASQPNVREDAA
jgi:hypothetical protein